MSDVWCIWVVPLSYTIAKATASACGYALGAELEEKNCILLSKALGSGSLGLLALSSSTLCFATILTTTVRDTPLLAELCVWVGRQSLRERDTIITVQVAYKWYYWILID